MSQPKRQTDSSETEKSEKLPLPSLIALVVGSMLGLEFLPRGFAAATGGFGALITWMIAGSGMYMLALAFRVSGLRLRSQYLHKHTTAEAGH